MLYIHIPFCASRCIYCDFFSTTRGKEERHAYVEALCKEMKERKSELGSAALPTVYLGGGTPSQLSSDELQCIFSAIHENFTIADDAEITVEANPDDMTRDWVHKLKDIGVNRVSLGVQTLNDERLKLLRRRHTAKQARHAIQLLCEEGITNLSIDLIYGLPGQGAEEWESELRQALSFPIKHLSAYCLMVEEGTALFHAVKAGKLTPADDETERWEYERLIDITQEAGFEHYEISNFALPGHRARHNSAYWNATPYLGLGPGAHSFNGKNRRLNCPDLEGYLASPGNPPHEVEMLTSAERFNEFVFTSLRTIEGLDLIETEKRFGSTWLDDLLCEAHRSLQANHLTREGRYLRLTREGIFVSDNVMSDLMR